MQAKSAVFPGKVRNRALVRTEFKVISRHLTLRLLRNGAGGPAPSKELLLPEELEGSAPVEPPIRMLFQQPYLGHTVNQSHVGNYVARRTSADA